MYKDKSFGWQTAPNGQTEPKELTLREEIEKNMLEHDVNEMLNSNLTKDYNDMSYNEKLMARYNEALQQQAANNSQTTDVLSQPTTAFTESTTSATAGSEPLLNPQPYDAKGYTNNINSYNNDINNYNNDINGYISNANSYTGKARNYVEDIKNYLSQYEQNYSMLSTQDYTNPQQQPYQEAQNSQTNVQTDATATQNTYPSAVPVGSQKEYSKMCNDLENTDVNNPAYQMFREQMDNLAPREGGYVDKPSLIEQPTNRGVTQSSLERYKVAHPQEFQQYNFPEDVKNLTQKQSDIIYCTDYFTKYRIPEIQSPTLREVFFDTMVNHSPTDPVKWLQESINANTSNTLEVDGVMGSATINALNQLNDEQINKINNDFTQKRLNDKFKRDQKDSEYKMRTNGLNDRIKKFFK